MTEIPVHTPAVVEHCRYCDALMWKLTNVNTGRRQVIDAKKPASGNGNVEIDLIRRSCRVLPKRELFLMSPALRADLYVDHHVTCHQWRQATGRE